MRTVRVELVSEHASPLAALGHADAGGQNVHVAALAAHLAGLGCDVTVSTRADAPGLPPRVRMAPGVPGRALMLRRCRSDRCDRYPPSRPSRTRPGHACANRRRR